MMNHILRCATRRAYVSSTSLTIAQVLLRPVNPGSNDVQPEESEVFRIVPDHGKV